MEVRHPTSRRRPRARRARASRGLQPGGSHGCLAAGRRTAAVCAGPLAFPLAGADGRSPGPDPPARDRAGGRGGVGRARDRWRPGGWPRAHRTRARGRVPLRCAWIWAPARVPSPCPWPARAGAGSRTSRSGPPTSRPMRWRWPARISSCSRATILTPVPGCGWPTGSWFGHWFAAPVGGSGRHRPDRGQPPLCVGAEYAELDPEVRDWEPESALVARSGTGRAGGMADIEAIVGRLPDGSDREVAWWWRSHPPRPPRRWMRLVAPASLTSPVQPTWPVGSACWWPGADRVGAVGCR